MLDLLNFQITFKDNNSYNEILLKFEEHNEKRKIILDELEREDITNWINKFNMDLNLDIEKTLDLGVRIKIINKTLKLKQKKLMGKNNINPNISYKAQLLKIDNKDIPFYSKNKSKDKISMINQKGLNKTGLLLTPIVNKIINKNSLLNEEKFKNNDINNKNNELKKESNDIISNNNDLQKKIITLNNELETEKINNNNLKNEINELKKKLNNEVNIKIELNKTILSKERMLNEKELNLKDLNIKIKNLEEIIRNNEDDNKIKLIKLIKLLEELRLKEKEIKEIKSRYPFELSPGEKLICIIIVSVDQKLHYPIICKSKDLFSKIEELLYEKYPEYSESENVFFVKGNKVNRFKDLEFNNIEYGDIIILKKIDDEE